MDIIEANEVFQYIYRPPLKGIFDNKEVDNLVGELYKRVSLKEAVKAQLAAIVVVEASAQVEDNMIDKKEGELDKQYTVIEIDYKTEVIGKK